jgi:hypothetical protein
MPAKFAQKPLGLNSTTTLYGYLSGDAFVEMFATDTYACGVSENKRGEMHPAEGAKEITQAHFNAAFLNVTDDELMVGEDTMNLGDLVNRYPVEA